jgi:hypothetical protein
MPNIFENSDDSTNFDNLSNNINISLNQGKKFKKYQNKIANNLENKLNKINIKEGFEVLPGLELSADGLTKNSIKIIKENNYSENEDTIDILREQYQKTLIQYQDLLARINGSTNSYLDRTNPTNPYLGKTIRFSTGEICYVTQQGVVKYIGKSDFWNNQKSSQKWIEINIPWKETYSTPGVVIPTTPELISGTVMQSNQTLGNEGKNVYVNSLVKNPKDKFLGCYNDIPQTTEINFVPIMNYTNNMSGYISKASSIYLNNNNICGPWAAFDRNSSTFWHSEVSASTNYNGITGIYNGTNGWQYKDANGKMVNVKGEWISIECPPGQVLTKYEIQGRQGCCGNPSGRSPNSWVVIGGVYNQSYYELVDKKDNQNLNFELRSYNINNPKKYNFYIFLTINCGNSGNKDKNRYCVQISQWNLYTSSNYTLTDDKHAMTFNSTIGNTDFDGCKNYAPQNGYQFFGLQNGKKDGTFNCVVSNDLLKSTLMKNMKNFTVWHVYGLMKKN